MYMRLGFAIAVHIEADVAPRRVFAVGDEAFQRKCIDRVLQFRERGGTLCFVSHDASAVERLCERAVLLTQGRVEYDERDERGAEALPRQAGGRRAPVRAGLREWGGEVRVADVLVEGVGGPTEQFTSGDALVVRLRLVVEAPVDPPRLSLELRDSGGGLLASSALDLDEVGWDGSVGEQSLASRSGDSRSRKGLPARRDAHRSRRHEAVSPDRRCRPVLGRALGQLARCSALRRRLELGRVEVGAG